MHMIVLASTSPRRRELLTQVGLTFTVASPDILEEPLPHEAAADYVSRMAEEKARAVFDRIAQTRPSDPSDPLIVIGADTCVLSEGEILGKPSNRAEAQTMLEHLSGRTHQVLTGVATVTGAGAAVAVEVSQVVFDLIKPEELRHYLDSGEPLDKAGLTASRATQPAGSHASKAATSTSSACPSPAPWPCWTWPTSSWPHPPPTRPSPRSWLRSSG